MILNIKEFFTNETKRSILFLVLAGISLLFGIFDPDGLPVNTAWVSIILCGVPIVKEAVIGLVTKLDIKADVLVSLALIASVLIGQTFAAGEVAFIMQIGTLLERLTVAKARAGIEKLVRLTPRTARLITGETESVIPAEDVWVGALLRVLPGEMIPVDGVVTDGCTSVNQSVLTGESLPVDKGKGDEVFSGTVNQFGTFVMRAAKVDGDSSLQRMIYLVQSADAGKAEIVRLADRWATWIVVTALSVAAFTWLVSGEMIRAVTVLVVFCPCALVLATPTAIMAAIGNATRHGFLVRQGDALERLALARRIAFDKTGTLTYGNPQVVAVQNFSASITAQELYRLAASAELRSEHPLGKSIVASYRQREKKQGIPEPEQFAMRPGRGVEAVVNGKKVLAGNLDLLLADSVTVPGNYGLAAQRYLEEGCTIIYLASEKQFCGFIALADTVRENAAVTVAEIKAVGVSPVLLTGDNRNAAAHIAGQLGITDIHTGCLPEDKLRIIGEYQQQKLPVCMIGDGINDAPALKKAMVGIAMGGIGSDIAVEAADITLVNDEIGQLPHLLRLAKRMMITIKLNLSFSMGLNFWAIVLAVAGILNPVFGALVHNAGSVFVILNSASLLKWKKELIIRKKRIDKKECSL